MRIIIFCIAPKRRACACVCVCARDSLEFEANGFDIFRIVINTISGAYGVPQIQIQGQWNAVGELCLNCIIENWFYFFLLFTEQWKQKLHTIVPNVRVAAI